MTHTFDVDLDFGNRQEILNHIQYTPALLKTGKKHLTGIYVTAIPQDPIKGTASIDHQTAEELGYFKIDFLNQSVYKLVRDPQHLDQLLAKPINWDLLHNKAIVEKLVHIGSYYDLIQRLPEPIDSIEKLSLFLAIIRPGKRHLQGLPWNIIRHSVWDKTDDGYSFKRAHGLAYSILVGLQINIIEESLHNLCKDSISEEMQRM